MKSIYAVAAGNPLQTILYWRSWELFCKFRISHLEISPPLPRNERNVEITRDISHFKALYLERYTWSTLVSFSFGIHILVPINLTGSRHNYYLMTGNEGGYLSKLPRGKSRWALDVSRHSPLLIIAVTFSCICGCQLWGHTFPVIFLGWLPCDNFKIISFTVPLTKWINPPGNPPDWI